MNIRKMVSVFTFGALLTGLFCTDALHARRQYYDKEYPGLTRRERKYYRRHCEGRKRSSNGSKVAKGAFFGGLLGTAIGGAAGGGKGAGIGAATGLGVGALAGAASSNGGGDPRECDRLNRKMDRASESQEDQKNHGGYSYYY